MSNPVRMLGSYGQSVWLGYSRRSLIASGELRRLIDDEGLAGVTSDPAILKAIADEVLAIRDIRAAADALHPVYADTLCRDGYVSLEVAPALARDTAGTIQEARRLWKAADRDNVMIEVPATDEGIPAIRALIGEGINVNVTLLFAQPAYERVTLAYMAGLEAWVATGGDPSRVASVASFFISRIDSLVDALIVERLKTVDDPMQQALLEGLLGKVAIATARLTYQRYKKLCAGPRWRALAAKGAQTQRLLWASTSAKSPSARDTLYVEELIGPDTVSAMPPATFDAFRDHGRPRASLEEHLDEARETMETLARVGISMADAADRLLGEGVALSGDAFAKLLAATARRRAAPAVNRLTWTLPAELEEAVRAEITAWEEAGTVRRLWHGDASLWTGTDEGSWLGWLELPREQLAHMDHLTRAQEDARTGGFDDVLVLGMGGSSLCPDVLRMTFGRVDGFPAFHVLDSTDPAQIRAVERKLDMAKTLFIVSSKSGTTLEPNIFKQYFFDRARRAVGPDQAGSRFIAVTDPGSTLQQVAEAERFRAVYLGVPSVGGRYSALSDFGMVPAAAMGLDVGRFLGQTEKMAAACGSDVAVAENPGAVLGIVLGVLAQHGRDKVTLIASPGIHGLGLWLEQLLAESTGKDGKGLIPVDREPPGESGIYGSDRLFVYLRLEATPDRHQDEHAAALQRAGHPVLQIQVAHRHDLGQELFRWEFATAVAGSLIGINPFNQPDVEASKIATRTLMDQYERTGILALETPILEGEGLKLYADERNAAVLMAAPGVRASVVEAFHAHFRRLQPGDYAAFLAYVEMTEAHEDALQTIRQKVRDRKRVATCVGFGPRFLHSTGQAYKGGPNAGVFVQITCDDAADLAVPGQKYTFGVVKSAQARGDFQVLAERGRRALRVHLGKDVPAGLETLRRIIEQALA